MEEVGIRKGGAGLTKPAQAFTHRTLKSLRPELAPYRIPDAGCRGLAVRVATNGVVTFDLAFRVKGGSPKRMSLGAFPENSLEVTRDRANEITKAARAGRDLVSEEKLAKLEATNRMSVAKLIDVYLKRVVNGRLRTDVEIARRLRRALVVKAEAPAETLRRRDLRELFDQVSDAGFVREAEKRRQTVGAMFRWAVASDLVEIDPTAGLLAYDPGKPRERFLMADEIRTFWAYLETGKVPQTHADVLRLQLLTGARCGEVAGMTVSEIDTASWVWTLPAERSKNGKLRLTPIVGRAREILGCCLKERGALFMSEANTTLTSALVGSVLRNHRSRIGIAHFGTHDLRRTVATSMDELEIAEETIASVLGHENNGGRQTKTLRRHYLHSDRIARKRVALEAWDAQLARIISGDGRPRSHVAEDAGNSHRP